MDHGATAQGMAQALAGSGVTISNVSFTGADNAAGNFTGGGGASLIGFNSGIALGSGSIQTPAGADPCNKGVEGPNQCDGNTTPNGTPGDADLNQLSGFSTVDAAVLEFDFVPEFGNVQFKYVFSSDEYNEYANSSFNDTFAFLVNGQNCALVPSTSAPVGVNTINGGNPLGTDPQNPTLYRNNDLSDGGGSIDTEMDGLTVVLNCNASVNPDTTNHLKLAIADASDQALDSNVFLQTGSLVSGTQVSTTLSGGGHSGAHITVPLGTSVRDLATLSGVNAANAGGTVTYSVYSDPGCQDLVANAGTKAVTNGQVAQSNPVSMDQGGTFYWQASYSGDPSTGNNASTTECGDETVTVTGVGEPTLTLAPGNATNPVGTSHTVTATLANPGGSISGQPILFKVTGANPKSGVEPTSPGGVAKFSYTGTQEGSDTIKACFDENGNHACGSGEATATATKKWQAKPTPPTGGEWSYWFWNYGARCRARFTAPFLASGAQVAAKAEIYCNQQSDVVLRLRIRAVGGDGPPCQPKGQTTAFGRCSTVAQIGCTLRPGCTARHLPQGLTRFYLPCPKTNPLSTHSYYSDFVFYRDGRPTRAVGWPSRLTRLTGFCGP
jgi:hypothetical protein